jgi:two-component system CheB/CheR fusion protein
MLAQKPFLIAGVGASAGGVDALERLFRPMPTDTGMAFVLMMHLSRSHESALPEIIGRCTTMRVLSASDGVAVEPNHVYVCPPGRILTVQSGQLRLREAIAGDTRPIDVFLSSLARDRGTATIGIVLSGSGNDGTLGIKAIKEQGGLTLAQGSDGNGPMQSGMPDSAIAGGVVDLALPVEEMPGRLADFARRFAAVDASPTAKQELEGDAEGYQAIYRLLRNQTGHDFNGYKENTFARRVQRRMEVRQIARLSQYVRCLQRDAEEVQALFRDLLIGVTNFFRDPAAFATLEKDVIPHLFEGKGPSDSVRIWVPGCATGEEAYSLAILLREHMDGLHSAPKIQLFATDIDERSLAVARAGRYPVPFLEDIGSRRLNRFFSGDDLSVVVNKDIRELCVFSTHSIIRDPPFSRIDLISCRNLLIYLGAGLQERVISAFHYALRPSGYLFLGMSENVSRHGGLFSPIDKEQRLFQRRDHVVVPLQLAPTASHGRALAPAERRHERGAMAADLRRAVEARIAEWFTPAHVVVNRDGDILHYSSRTGKYLEPAPGVPNRQLMAMARRDLRLDLRAALNEVMATKQPAARHRVSLEIDDRLQLVDLTIHPIGDHDPDDPLFLVVFTDVGPPYVPSVPEACARDPDDQNGERLEQELHTTREELQSTNEELETSKEELQSINEELHTVNSELKSKIDEADRAQSDLRNLFDATGIATIFLDQNLIIRSYNAPVAEIFNVISTDLGRPLTDLVSRLDDKGDLKRDIRTVFEHDQTIERRVQRADGKAHYLMRVLPYRTPAGVTEGVLLTFVGVTKVVEAEAHLRTLVEELNHRVRNMLAVVSAVASQTLAKSRSPKDFTKAFLGRIGAMAKSYGLVANKQWGDVSLDAILMTELESYVGGAKDRFTIKGPSLLLDPRRALALGLVFHELATNATKYGALSKAKGRIAVTWAVKKGCLVLDWRESDGPKVRQSARRGFGTELVERQIKSALDGDVEFNYRSDGLAVRISIPIAGSDS